MRILILANLDVGLYKFRKELIRELICRGHEIYISLPEGDLIRSLEEMGCCFIDTPIDRRGINPITDLGLFYKYKKIISQVKPNLVITYTIKPNIYGGIVCRMEKTQYVVNITGLGTAFEKGGWLEKLVKSLYRVALKNSLVVFFENSFNRELFIKKRIIRQSQSKLLMGAGVNLDDFMYLPYPHNDTTRFLFLGRVMKEKGIDELLFAISHLNNKGIQCFLDVVGPCEENYQKVLNEYESFGWIKYHGYKEDVIPYISNADCLILPSYHEGMANTILESASSGRAVIASNIPGCKESVLDGESGFLCKVKDKEDLCRRMKEFIELPYEQKRNFGIVGRRHMKRVFDKKIIVRETIVAIYNAIENENSMKRSELI